MNRKVSVAPMMDCTDRHERFFLRLISKNTLLYTEMIVDEAINRGDKKKLLEFNIDEKPLALQLGGSSPKLLAEASKIGEDFRIGFMLECALAVTAYKLQGKNETCAKIVMKDFAQIPGLFNVSISRVRHPNDNYIPEGMFPTALDINLQRLNPAVIEAEIFERVVKKMSLKTLCKYSIEFGEN